MCGRSEKKKRTQKLAISGRKRHYRFYGYPRIITDYYEQLHDNKFNSLEEIDQFLDRHKLPKLVLEKSR